MKVHLVDGTYELFRAFYGSPPKQASDGAEVGAVRGLVRSMLVLLGEADVTHVGIAFDHVIESFRNALYRGYKTGEGIDPALYSQFGLAEEATRALGLVTWPMIDFEADDAIATAAVRCAASSEVEQVVICSPDKDLTQCVKGQRIVCRDRMRGTVLDEAGVTEKFGVGPASIPDWLALVGDSADGFPGIARWGAKSAAAVLAVYKTLDAIPDDESKWTAKVRGAAVLAENLRAGRDAARLFRTLATLRYDAPLAESLDDLEWRGPDERALAALGKRLGDGQWLEQARALRR
ncbi:MAG TPA: 5'-3' exonuclease H3TH domain-containing protein [Pseudomonadales bacterium]|nr:5'-3' exonuclease H3TH domain-containing protein [Pseudomonadales bacterium]